MRDIKDHLELCAVNTACFGFREPLPVLIDAVARAGFGGIAMWRREVEGYDAKALGRQIRDAGLKVTGYCRSTYLVAEDAKGIEWSVTENKKAMDDGVALGSDSFVFVVGGSGEGTGGIAVARQQVTDGLGRLLEHGRDIGIKCAVEPLHPMYSADRSVITRLSEALDICDALEPDATDPQIGVVIDVYHTFWDIDLAPQIARAGAAKRIFGFHVDDWLVPTKDLLNDRGMMGDGVIDLRGIRRAVEAAGYQGLIEAEIFSSENWWKCPKEKTLRVLAERFQTVV